MTKHPSIEHYERLKRAKLRAESKSCSDEEFERYFSMLAKYKKPNKATALEKMIVEFLKMEGHSASKVSTMGVYKDDSKVVTDVLGHQRTVGRGRYIKGGARKGFSDVDSVVYGVSVKIEIKFKKDRMSLDQKKFKEETEKAGGFYIIARTFEQFYDDYISILHHPKMVLMKEYYELNK